MNTNSERHPNSVAGEFYVVNGECLACGLPHVIAPELVGWVDERRSHCVWKKQPSTHLELDHAIEVLEAQEVDCHRYAGEDPAILARVRSSLCDHPSTKPLSLNRSDIDIPSFLLLNRSPGVLSGIWRALMLKR